MILAYVSILAAGAALAGVLWELRVLARRVAWLEGLMIKQLLQKVQPHERFR